MTALDAFVLVVAGFLAARGFSRGFVTEALSLGAWVVAVLAVKTLASPTASAIEGQVGSGGGALVIAFAATFGLAFILGQMAAHRLGKAARSSVLGGFDRVLGLGFGALKGLAVATMVFLLVSIVYNTIYGGGAARPDWVEQSRTYPLLNALSRAVIDYVDDRQDAEA